MSIYSNIIISIGGIFCFLDSIVILATGKNIARGACTKIDAILDICLAINMLAILTVNSLLPYFFSFTNDTLSMILSVLLVILMLTYIIRSNFTNKKGKGR